MIITNSGTPSSWRKSSSLFVLFFIIVLVPFSSRADVNVLILGATNDSRDSFRIDGGDSEAFNPTEIGTQLQSILGGAGLGNVNVVVEDRAPNTFNSSFPLISWFYYPYPADVEATTRWPNLRGEGGTDWDYVVIIGDPYIMEKLPGIYAHGVAKVAEEVVKGGAEPILLMPWPAPTSTSTVNHYKEVVYRAGRSGGYRLTPQGPWKSYMVAPAALAWQAAGSPAAGGHPNADGAFICAASIYSRIWGQSASTSTYHYNNALADSASNTVASNIGVPQYTGNFTFHSPTMMEYNKSRLVDVRINGASTESGVANCTIIAHARAGVTRSSAPGRTLISNANGGRHVFLPTAGMSFGFPRHFNTNNNTYHIDNIYENEIKLANGMLTQDQNYRLLPRQILWAEFSREYPDALPLSDGVHLSDFALFAMGTFSYTLASGRCPLDPKPDPVTDYWLANKIAYEAAWNMGRCQTRAPGFKVMPSKASRHTIDVSTPELMEVQFILPPQENVTVNVSSSNPNVTVSPQTLTFTPANYDQPQVVSVTPLASLAPGETTDIVYNTVSNDEVYDDLDDSWRYRVNTRPIADDKTVEIVSGVPSGITMTGSDDIDYPLGHENESLSYTVLIAPSKGTLEQIGSTELIYTPNPGASGQDSFTYKVNDGSGESTAAVVTINIIEYSKYDRNLVYNGNAELAPFVDHGWIILERTWSQQRALAPRLPDRPAHSVKLTPEAAPVFNLQEGYASFKSYGPKGASAELYQDIDVSEYSNIINLGQQSFHFSGYCWTHGDDANIIIECRAANEQVLSTYNSGDPVGNWIWTFKEQTIIAPANTAHIRVRLYSKDTGGAKRVEGQFDDISLVALKPVSPYADWSNGSDFADDDNGDGVSNGVAWVSGSTDPSADAANLLPVAELGTDPAYFVFHYRRSEEAHEDPSTTIIAQYSLDMKTWNPCVHDGDDIIITEMDDFYGSGVDKVEVKLKRTMAIQAGIFSRLQVAQ